MANDSHTRRQILSPVPRRPKESRARCTRPPPTRTTLPAPVTVSIRRSKSLTSLWSPQIHSTSASQPAAFDPTPTTHYTHKGGDALYPVAQFAIACVAPSFNGRTDDSESFNRGSNPWGATISLLPRTLLNFPELWQTLLMNHLDDFEVRGGALRCVSSQPQCGVQIGVEFRRRVGYREIPRLVEVKNGSDGHCNS